MANRYPLNIEWSEDDQEYIATCPAFPGLSAFGETEEEALKEGKIALAGFVETCKVRNISLPEASVRESYSGKFQVRLPKSLHRLAVQMAVKDGISLNQFVVSAVERRVGVLESGSKVLAGMKQAWSEYASQFRVALASALTSDERITTAQPVSETSYTRTERVITGSTLRGN